MLREVMRVVLVLATYHSLSVGDLKDNSDHSAKTRKMPNIGSPWKLANTKLKRMRNVALGIRWRPMTMIWQKPLS